MQEKLNPKEKLFCFYYAELGEAKEAALKAGYPKALALKQGLKLLSKGGIRDEIRVLSEKNKKRDLKNRAVAGLLRLAFSSDKDSIKLLLYDKERLINELPELDLFHVSEIKIPKENAVEIKFFDRFKAFEKLVEIAGSESSEGDSLDFYAALENTASSFGEEEE